MEFNRDVLDAERFISKAELEDLYTNKKLPDSEIGKMFGISGGKIHRLRNRYNIKAIEYYQRHHKQELSDREKAFLIGVLLGDGHIRLREESGQRAYPQLMIEQSVIYRDYLFWLWDEIREWIYDINKTPKQVRKYCKANGKTYHSYPFQTICHPVFNDFFNAFYKDGVKVVNIEFIKKYFTDYSFAIWIMDDGARDSNQIEICSHSFTKEENEELKKLLDDKYGTNVEVRYYEPYYHLCFSAGDSKKISAIVRNIVVPSMQYKLASSETTNGTAEKEIAEGIVRSQE